MAGLPLIGEGTASAVGESLGHMKSTATCSLQRQLSASTRSMLQHLKACPTHPGLGLPILDPISLLEQCDETGVAIGVMCGKPCGHWQTLDGHLEGGVFDEHGPFEGIQMICYSRPFLDDLEAKVDPPAAAQKRMWKTNTAIANMKQGILKSFQRGSLLPCCMRAIMYHTSTHNGKSTFQNLIDLLVVLQTPAWPSSGYTSHGRPQIKHMLSDGQPRLGTLSVFELHLQPDDPHLASSSIRDHSSFNQAPAMITLCTANGHVITQNAISRAMLGVLGSDSRPSCMTDSAPTLVQPENNMNYLLELFGSQAALDLAFKQVADEGSFRKRMEITSSTILKRMRQTGVDQVHHEVMLVQLRDPATSKPGYLVTQMDITESYAAQQQVAAAQSQQQSLLRNILPQQVIDVLLDEGRRSTTGKCPYSSADETQLQDLSSCEVQQLSTYHSCVSILFAHIEGFKDVVQQLHPGKVMLFLNDLFNEFDLLVEEHDVYKVETIGDTYMVCSGLFDRSSQQQPSQAPSSTATPADVTQPGQERTSTASFDNTNQNVLGGHDPQHASKMVAFAKALLLVSSSVVSPLGEAVKLHVGVHSGPIMTGVVGRKMPRFCCFGDTVNTASRMMTTSGPDIIHASASFRDLTPDQPWQPTGGIQVKGKGHMETFQMQVTSFPTPPYN